MQCTSFSNAPTVPNDLTFLSSTELNAALAALDPNIAFSLVVPTTMLPTGAKMKNTLMSRKKTHGELGRAPRGKSVPSLSAFSAVS